MAHSKPPLSPSTTEGLKQTERSAQKQAHRQEQLAYECCMPLPGRSMEANASCGWLVRGPRPRHEDQTKQDKMPLRMSTSVARISILLLFVARCVEMQVCRCVCEDDMWLKKELFAGRTGGAGKRRPG
ncbi:hypothetical protein CLAIMM_06065, partial [Cladophialophora immunda]